MVAHPVRDSPVSAGSVRCRWRVGTLNQLTKLVAELEDMSTPNRRTLKIHWLFQNARSASTPSITYTSTVEGALLD